MALTDARDPELEVRARLAALASTERGRALLQLSLRGIETGEHELTAGCWLEGGIAGCLFQHAYWQGVREGVFPDRGRPGDWIGSFVGSDGYGDMIAAIAAFDRLARERYETGERPRLRWRRRPIDHARWRAAVASMLVDALAAAEPWRDATPGEAGSGPVGAEAPGPAR
jgi:hypothetical protein